jgi:small subunit ribosomal protein S3
MAHKVHPKAYRIKGIADWSSRGFYRTPAVYLEEDFRIREFLKEKIGKIGIEKIDIERSAGKISVIIFSARPGLIIGRGGEGIELLKKSLEKKVLSKKAVPVYVKIALKNDEVRDLKKKGQGGVELKAGSKERKEVRIEIREIKDPWASASLVAQWVAQQIEKRVPYRKVLKQGLAKVSAHKEIQGVKIEVSGRLNGNEIARREWLKSGRLPLQTLRSDIDYMQTEAYCTYGVIGVKVWIYKGEKFD